MALLLLAGRHGSASCLCIHCKVTVFLTALQRCAPARTRTSATGKSDPRATAVKGAMGAVGDPDAMGAAGDLDAMGAEDLGAMGAPADLGATGAVGGLDATEAGGDPAMESHKIASSKFIRCQR